MSDSLVILIQNTFWAGVAALGFAILFNVPPRTLILAAIGGAAGYAVRSGLVQSGITGVEMATLVAAMLVSLLGVWFGRRWHTPPVVFVIPGVIPLVPGALAFRTMIDILVLTTDGVQSNETILTATAANTIKTLLIVGAIASGIAVPSLLLRRHRPMM
jgi:uncharacterized membrane protein YjjB (DUF3815 family)